MIHFKDKEKYVLGVYVVGILEDSDPTIRRALELEGEEVLNPQQMCDSPSMRVAYVLDTTGKVVYSRSNVLGNDVHIYLEKSSGRVVVRVRHLIRSKEPLGEAHKLVEQLAATLSEKGFRPVESRIEDIPDFCFV